MEIEFGKADYKGGGLNSSLHLYFYVFTNEMGEGGAWVVQSIKRPTWAQVMISPFMRSSPRSGSVLTAGSLEPASDSVSPSLSAPPQLMLCLSLSQK